MTRVVADNLGPANSGGERRLARTVAMEDGHAGPPRRRCLPITPIDVVNDWRQPPLRRG